MGLGVAHDQDSDGGQGAYARDHEPVTPTEFEDEYSEDGLEHWNDEIAEIEAQQEELEKRARGVYRLMFRAVSTAFAGRAVSTPFSLPPFWDWDWE